MQKVIDHFEIPEEIAKTLSTLLNTQVIKERLLVATLDDEVKYKKVEEALIPITGQIEAIKYRITNEFVPEKYRSPNYMWNYNGWDVDNNRVQVIGEETTGKGPIQRIK